MTLTIPYRFGDATQFDRQLPPQIDADFATVAGQFPTTSTDKAAVRYNGTLGVLQDSSLIIDGSGNVSSFGGQIAFPATQNPSSNVNTLDDYEEGTWTPVLTFATPGDLAVTYSVQVGSYIKIGELVIAPWNLLTSSFTRTTAVGALLITGLPFTPFAGIGGITGTIWSGITKAGYTSVNGQTVPSVTQLNFFGSGSGVGSSQIVVADVPSGGTVLLNGTAFYFT